MILQLNNNFVHLILKYAVGGSKYHSNGDYTIGGNTDFDLTMDDPSHVPKITNN